MPKKSNEPSRRYHDRVARRYDAIYDDPFWEFHDCITWNHLKHFVPREPAAAVLDLGCGTGKWGLRLLKMGFAVTFVDHSQNMLEEVQAKLERWKQQSDLSAKAARGAVLAADALDLGALPPEHFALVVGMGDVVSICGDAGKCLSELRRVLKPGAVAVFTVDNALAAIDHFVDKGDLDALDAFAKTGRTAWLTQDKSEQFPLQMFTPETTRKLVRNAGLEWDSMIGKTIIPARLNKKLFESERALVRLIEMEETLARDPAAAARASHLQVAARRP